MLSVACNHVPRAGTDTLVRFSPIATRSLLRTINHRGQARYFRWGLWSAFLQSGLHRKDAQAECQQPKLLLRRRCRGPFGVRFVWQPKGPTKFRGPWGGHRFPVRPYWYSDGSWRGDGCGAKEHSRQKSGDNENGTRPGRNIEDVERNAMEFLLYGEKGRKGGDYGVMASAFESVKNWVDMAVDGAKEAPSKSTSAHQKSKGDVDAKPVIIEAKAEDEEYVIDPITNRKVLKSTADAPEKARTSSTSIPVKTFKTYRSQFTGFEAPECKSSQPSSRSDERLNGDKQAGHRQVTRDALEIPRGQVNKEAAERDASRPSKGQAQSSDESGHNGPELPGPTPKQSAEARSPGPSDSKGTHADAVASATNATNDTVDSWPGFTDAFGSTSSWLGKFRSMTWNPSPEERAEDLDLLRPSDVRSAAGINKSSRVSRPADDAKFRRKKLEESMAEQERQSKETDIQASSSVKERLEKARARGPSPELDAQSKVNAQTTKEKSGLSGGMTGNYARDFPEEFATSWSATGSSVTQAGAAEKDDSTKLVPALDRQASGAKPSGSSAQLTDNAVEDRDSQKEADQALVKEIRQIYEDGYGKLESTIAKSLAALSKPATSTSTAPNTQPPTPTLYKILAYDPTMQTINEAETTSVVADSSAALTPAEVLLRLSNPSKFFPHFKPLQEQGFEIASGSGDVLVFRKVREPVASPRPPPRTTAGGMPESSERNSTSDTLRTSTAATVATASEAASAAAESSSSPPPPPSPGKVNPIDLMGRDARADFDEHYNTVIAPMWTTSMTGFVNYNRLRTIAEAHAKQQAEEEKALLQEEEGRRETLTSSSGFKSNIDVRREEPVFSGSKEWAAESAGRSEDEHGGTTGRKKSMGRRMLVGAAWVGGLSYAIGVISEYFVTGGMDGKGPTWF